jgi:hypothetical protein
MAVAAKKRSEALDDRMSARRIAYSKNLSDSELPKPPIVWHRVFRHASITVPTIGAVGPAAVGTEQEVIDIIRRIEALSDGAARHAAHSETAEKNKTMVGLWDDLRACLTKLSIGGEFSILDAKSMIRWNGAYIKWSHLFSDTGREGLVSKNKWDPIKKNLLAMTHYRTEMLQGLSLAKAKGLYSKGKRGE